MNTNLSKEIIKHIFMVFGAFEKPIFFTGLAENILSNTFLTSKKIAFETEDGEVLENNIWSASSNINNSILSVLIADVSDDELKEYVLVLKFDEFSSYVLKMSEDKQDNGQIFFNINDNNWISANLFLQAKLLAGIEQLSQIMVSWEKDNRFDILYKDLIGFLNFENA